MAQPFRHRAAGVFHVAVEDDAGAGDGVEAAAARIVVPARVLRPKLGAAARKARRQQHVECERERVAVRLKVAAGGVAVDGGLLRGVFEGAVAQRRACRRQLRARPHHLLHLGQLGRDKGQQPVAQNFLEEQLAIRSECAQLKALVAAVRSVLRIRFAPRTLDVGDQRCALGSG